MLMLKCIKQNFLIVLYLEDLYMYMHILVSSELYTFAIRVILQLDTVMENKSYLEEEIKGEQGYMHINLMYTLLGKSNTCCKRLFLLNISLGHPYAQFVIACISTGESLFVGYDGGTIFIL